ncbi:MAG: hypothetical protein GY754_20115 [bacterium]|nr:hypothetical protein [bacterium]
MGSLEVKEKKTNKAVTNGKKNKVKAKKPPKINFYFRFLYYDPLKKKDMDLPEGLDVKLLDYDPVSKNEQYGKTVKTTGKKEKPIHISFLKKDMEEKEPDLFFVIETKKQFIDLENDKIEPKIEDPPKYFFIGLPEKITSKNKTGTNNKKGYLENYTKNGEGTEKDPWTFKLEDIKVFIRLRCLENGSDNTKYIPMPKKLVVTGYDADWPSADDFQAKSCVLEDGKAYLPIFMKDETEPDLYFSVKNSKTRYLDLKNKSYENDSTIDKSKMEQYVKLPDEWKSKEARDSNNEKGIKNNWDKATLGEWDKPWELYYIDGYRPVFVDKYKKEKLTDKYLYAISEWESSGEPKKVAEYYLGNDGKPYDANKKSTKSYIRTGNYYFFLSPYKTSSTAQKELRKEDCGKINTVKEKKDQEIKLEVLAPGDIILREGEGNDSELIMGITGGKYSHAGIICYNSSEKKMVVVDAYPGRGPARSSEKKASKTSFHAIKAITVKDFVDHSVKTDVYRYKGSRDNARKAARWALAQEPDTNYLFSLFDETLSKGDKNLYCSEFVYYCYQEQGANLVPIPLNIKSTANKSRTLQALMKFTRAENSKAHLLSDTELRTRLENDASYKNHGGIFVSPQQLADSGDTAFLLKLK